MPKRKSNSKEKNTQLNFPIVGIGASAGGISAFGAFFSAIPTGIDPNMAFVLVQHLAPDHKSILTEIIQRHTKMKVYEVEDGMEVRPNCTYIIKPNYDMAFINGRLQLLEPPTPRGHRLPIDFFFRSLAQDQHEKAIGIILSGTGSDGTQGVKAIKEEGGMVIAQKPISAEYDGMPSSAISTGLVDFELLPNEMPTQLVSYATHAFHFRSKDELTIDQKHENELNKIFIILRSNTRHDFSQYKLNTINRRIARRMALHQIEKIGEYVTYIQQTPSEIDALFQELLIGVTNFFRDTDAFKSLEKIIPKLFINKSINDTIRVWTAGCSTGEEAYSIAILIKEHMLKIQKNYTVQIFATDIDPIAIAKARAGVYPTDIASDVSTDRLSHFFKSESNENTYQINKNIRDMLIFSEQDLIKDPPFSKMDLISCRNLLIYMNANLQKKVIPLFHYALNPGGILFLGSSETIGDNENLFSLIDSKSNIYERKEHFNHRHNINMGKIFPNTDTLRSIEPQVIKKEISSLRLPFKELTEHALLEYVVNAATLVNDKGDIFYLHGHTGTYFELPSGEPSVNNIIKMARKGLKRGISVALHKAVQTKETVHSLGLKVKVNKNFVKVNIAVVPINEDSVRTQESQLYLVIFEEVFISEEEQIKFASKEGSLSESESESKIDILTKELQEQEDFLKTANEQLENSNEELKSFSEELQSMNEELQSSNEELETSKEELQSVNEELSTVNTELQIKVSDLSRSNNDMNNLLAGTDIGTVFVDEQLCILRFTPALTKVINLLPGDIGRPLNHIASNLVDYDKLKDDIQNTLDTLIPKEIEVQTTDGNWFMMRIQPYRTLENIIEGVVITFVDITQITEMKKTLNKKNNELMRMATIIIDSNDAITLQDLEGNTLAWNPMAQKMYGWNEAEALKINIKDRIPNDMTDEELENIKKLSKHEIIKPYMTKRKTKSGSIVDILLISTALINEDGELYAIATTEREIKKEST
ncbi:CheR family methyltransferase [Sulfurimonas sp.]|uniref:CheR family methyltransferase n=1 Tax=Sulfurimonas sp. TaxID=2022749 RepID=UPI003564D6B6